MGEGRRRTRRRNRRQRRRNPGRKPRRFLRRGERGAQGRARPCAPRAEEELSAVKSELEESRAAAAASEENLRSLSEAYNGLEAEVFRHEEESRGLRARARLEAFEKNAGASAPVAAPPAADALAAAKEEGRREAVDQMARRLEETEMAAAADVEAARADATELRRQLEAAREEGRRAATDEMASRIEASAAEAEAAHEAELGDLLVCLGQEESKRTRSTRDWWRNTARARLNSTRCWNRASRTTTKKTRERGAPPSARRKRQSRAPS